MKKQEIVLEIDGGIRHAVHDADEITSNEDGNEIYAVHYADDGSVNIDFEYKEAVSVSHFDDGPAFGKFDIFNNE